MKKILVLLDFSPVSMHAYRFALDIAAANDGEIIALKITDVLASCSEDVDGAPFYTNSISGALMSKRQAEIDFEQLRNRISTNVPVSFEVDQGAISHAILKAIYRHEVDLVIIGITAVKGTRELLEDARIARIVKSSPVPVFVIHNPQKITDIRNIIFLTTIQAKEGAMLEKIIRLQRLFHAQLHLLYTKTSFVTQTDRELTESLERFAQFYALSNYKIHIGHESDPQPDFKLASRLGYSIIAAAPDRLGRQPCLVQESTAEGFESYV